MSAANVSVIGRISAEGTNWVPRRWDKDPSMPRPHCSRRWRAGGDGSILGELARRVSLITVRMCCAWWLVREIPSGPPPAEAALRARVAELEAANAALREAAAARDELAAAQLAARDAQLAVLAARVEELERRLGKDSSTSSKPPSSDSPHKKKTRDRSLRGRSGRAPGKQPGAPSSTLKQSADPRETVKCGPAACGCCGADLADAEVTGVQKRQVVEASPPPPPAVIEYQVQAKTCGNCGTVSIGLAPAHVTGRVQYGPGVHARAALAVCAHYLPAGRAAALVASLAGVKVSAQLRARGRGRAAPRLDPLMDPGRALLPR